MPAGEVLAAPSADGIDVAVCLLDVAEAVRVADWARSAIAGEAPVFRAGWWRAAPPIG